MNEKLFKKTIDNSALYLGLCVLYGLNQIAVALNSKDTTAISDAVSHINNIYHINKE
jgi:hypothetical protein